MNEENLIKLIIEQSEDIILQTIIDNMDADTQYPNLEAKVVSLKIASKSEYQRAVKSAARNRRVLDRLGVVPTTTEELVEALLNRCDFTIDVTAENPLSWISPVQHRRCRLAMDELLDVASDIDRNLLNGQFKKSNIADQIAYMEREFNHEVLKGIREKVTQPGTFDWDMLAKTCFRSDNIPAELTIAVLKKFIWQVKRRLTGLPVTYHTMPILYSSQGSGKSEFIRKIIGVVGSLYSDADFGRISDNREANLFRSYILFLDEMHKADKADMNAVKNVITRPTFSYRPMGTNTSVTVDQNSTFIGASNKLLEQLINDPTGIRRFFQLDYISMASPELFAFVNSLDYTAMWCSVDHEAADPTEPFRDQMAAIQSTQTTRTSVGEFADALVSNEGRYLAPLEYGGGIIEKTLPTDVMKKDFIFLAYRDWCAAMRKSKPLEQNGFLAELRRMSQQEAGFPLQPKKTNKCNGWHYSGPQAPATKAISALNLGGVLS